MTCIHGHHSCWLWAQLNQYYRDLRFLVAPVFLDLSTRTSRRQCLLRLSRTSSVTSVGAIVTFYLPRATIWLSLHVMNLLLYFPGKVGFLTITGMASLMPLYGQRVVLRVTDLTWVLMMELAWLFSSMSVRRHRNFSSRMLLSLNPNLRTILSSILSKSSSRAN